MVQLVGILNITPDSFSDGGLFFDVKKAIKQAEQLFDDGASIVDVGAESTRPNAMAITANQEWERLEPVLNALIPRYPGKISVDSYRPETIMRANAIGPVMINDITGLNNPAMVDVVAGLDATVIISHLPGIDIQKAHSGKLVDSVKKVKKDLLEKTQLLEDKGLKNHQIILDPGIGFGKTMELNNELLKFAEQVPGYSVIIGYSRKRFLGEKRMDLAPNLEAGKIAIASGAAYIRIHDVAGHKQLL